MILHMHEMEQQNGMQGTRWKIFSGTNIKSWKNKKEPNEPSISKIIKVWKKRVIWKYLSGWKKKVEN
jgi:hypothetical protein